jgi:hypothetical protein
MPDEVFVLRELGCCIRIADLIHAVNRAPELSRIEVETARLAVMRRSDRLSKSYLGGISEPRLSEPVLVGALAEALWIIDGNHRLERRIRLQIEHTGVIFVPADVLLQHLEALDF